MELKELLKQTRKLITLDFPKEIQYFNSITSREDLLGVLRKDRSIEGIHGVYIITQNNLGVVYVGCSGKIGTDRGWNSENGIGGRLKRSHSPYSFVGDYLCYEKIGSGTKKEINNYSEKILLNKISVFIIPLERNSPIIPSVLEHIILQTFYNKNKKKKK